MYQRQFQKQFHELLQQFPAVGLLGPRQAGKTTLAFAQKALYPDALYLDLELPSAQRQLDDPEAFLMAHAQQLVILDEVQRMPELFGVLRGVIDQRRRMGQASGQFLLLGSASGVLLQQSSESLAGGGLCGVTAASSFRNFHGPSQRGRHECFVGARRFPFVLVGHIRC